MDEHVNAESKKRYDRFRKGLRLVGYSADVEWLLGREEADYEMNVPFADHGRQFVDMATKERILVSQPYVCSDQLHTHDCGCGKTVESVKAASEQFAEQHGLAVHVSFEDSWHYPGSTVLVVYRKK
jgi:hypothetical protein